MRSAFWQRAGMKRVELYGRVRHAIVVQGMSRREAARIFGIDRRTVEKMLAFSVPPGYRRSKPVRRPKLDPFTGIIDQSLRGTSKAPKKQRHTSKRIFERLRDEHGFTGGITIVKDYIFAARQRQREMFVPLSHPPGHAQVDFGEALGVIGGVERKIHFLVMDLPQSDACFVKAYPARRRKHSATGMFGVCVLRRCARNRSCTTTPRLRWPAFLGMADANGPGCSPNWSPIICLRTALADPARAMTRAKSRGWSDTPGATSWCR